MVFGGIAAGLVINAIELLFHRVLLDKQWTAAFTIGQKACWLEGFYLFELPAGRFAVALYAWLRPRYSPTWKSAALAAVPFGWRFG